MSASRSGNRSAVKGVTFAGCPWPRTRNALPKLKLIPAAQNRACWTAVSAAGPRQQTSYHIRRQMSFVAGRNVPATTAAFAGGLV
jgi:hypothetical protein